MVISQIAPSDVRISVPPPELSHEYSGLGRRSKETQIKRR
jgi:hypothetical protein